MTLTFDLESDVRVTCNVGYLCANFSLPIGLSVLDLGPMYATDRRQTSVDSMWGPHDMGVANSIRSGTRVSFCILLHNVGVANLHT